MIDLKSNENTFRIHPEDEPKYNRPEITGVGLMEQIDSEDKYPSPSKESIDKHVENNLKPFKEYNDSMENYIELMNTFLNRRERRKLSRYKGFKSFSDRIYNGRK